MPVVLKKSTAHALLKKLAEVSGQGVKNPDYAPRDLNGGGSGRFSGTAYVMGARTTGLNSDSSKPWVRIDLSTGAATEQTGPPSFPFGDNYEWYEKSKTPGDIHLPRA